MVRSFGQSGAWKTVQEAMRRIDTSLRVDSPSALSSLIDQRAKELEGRQVSLTESLGRNATAELAKLEVATQQAHADQAVAARTATAEANILTRQIQDITDSLRSVGLLRRWWRMIRVLNLRIRIQRLLAKPVAAFDEALRMISAKASRARRIQQDPGAEARALLAGEERILGQLRALEQSPESRGAQGELAVIKELQRLPDDYALLNDLTLKAPGFMRHAGKVLQSAQVDHVVVGPAGVFLLETKAWTRQFAQQGTHFDPFEQVSRAGLLCHVLLKETGLPAAVQNILVTNIRLPRSSNAKFVQVVAPTGLTEFILRKASRLRSDEVDRITKVLRGHLA